MVTITEDKMQLLPVAGRTASRLRHRFRVWAPAAQQLKVIVDGGHHAMEFDAEGWWSAEVDIQKHGSDYAFLIDGDTTALPDPRSSWQPKGVHAASRIVDHSAFRWTDDHFQARPLASGVVYELHIGTFTPQGTFDSAIERLDELVDLGITHVELMPVNQFSGTWGWGYDGVGLYAPHNAYGEPESLKRLVDACHRRGLAVVLDVVYNHLGPVGNYLSRFGPYFSHEYNTPWGAAVNLDGAHSHHVRRFFIDNAMMWMRDYHFDGLRIDAIHALIDNGACHFLEQLAAETAKLAAHLGRNLVLIAESDLNDPRIVRSRDLGGYGLDAQWSDDFHHALHTVITGERTGYYKDFGTITQLGKALKNVFVYDGEYSPYRKRPHGRATEGLPGDRFLAYIQNHDQIGNRAAGDRIAQLTTLRRAKIAAGFVFLSPYVPMIFQGEEWAASTPFQYFTQHEDEALGRAVSEGRKNEFVSFGWKPEQVPDPQDPQTFERSKLRWEERTRSPHAEMLDWYRSLIRFRRSEPSLTDSDRRSMEVHCSEPDQWLVLHRGPISAVCNFGDQPRILELAGGGELVLASAPGVELKDREIVVPGETFAVLKR
jgi:maltooligosyltrehalose trehalohydrolase